MARILVAVEDRFVIRTTDVDVPDSWRSWPNTQIVDVPMTAAQIDDAVKRNIVFYKEGQVLKGKWRHTDGKYYLVKVTPDYNLKYVDGQVLLTFADYPRNLEEEVNG